MKALIFDGSTDNNIVLKIARENAEKKLKNMGWDVTIVVLRNIKIAPCRGCFNCWVKTPGTCVTNDAGRDIAKSIVQGDLFIFLTSITFGGYSSELKKAIDRLAPLANPFFMERDGRTQHIPRYKKVFRFCIFGTLEHMDEECEQIFRKLVYRNSVNFINSIYECRILLNNEARHSIDGKINSAISGCLHNY